MTRCLFPRFSRGQSGTALGSEVLCYRQDTFLERVSVHRSEAEWAACRKARIVSWSAKTGGGKWLTTLRERP